MKLMFASDIHGSGFYAEKLKEIYYKNKMDKLILLGDLLYHGPRNDLSVEYNPKKVIDILNDMKQEIICVRGNCDSEVDQMVLEFPITADYSTILIENKTLFITHGHIYNKDNLPKIKDNYILIHGHTHIPTIDIEENFIYINPGSITFPKQGNPHTYMVYEDKEFKILDLNGNILNSLRI